MSAGLDTISKSLTVVSLAIAMVAAWKALPLDADLKSLQAQTQRLDIDLKAAEQKLREAESRLKEAESSRKLTLDLYQEVKRVLEAKEHTSRDEEVLRVLVESLAEDPFRYKLLSVLAAGATNPELKRSASESSNFYQEEAQLMLRATGIGQVSQTAAPGAHVIGNYDVDVIYCTARQQTAEQVARKAIALKLPGETGRWRLRALPQSINQQPGYGIAGNEIRFNVPDESKVADILRKRLAGAGINVKSHETQQPTKWYVSVFICE